MKLSNSAKVVFAIILVLVAATAWQKYQKNEKAGGGGGADRSGLPDPNAAPASAFDYGDMNWTEGPPGMEAFDEDGDDEAFEASMSEEVYDTPTSHPLPLDFLGTNSKYVRKSLRV